MASAAESKKPFEYLRMGGAQAPTPRRLVEDAKLDREFSTTDQALSNHLGRLDDVDKKVASLPIVSGHAVTFPDPAGGVGRLDFVDINAGASTEFVHGLDHRAFWMVTRVEGGPATLFDATPVASQRSTLRLTNSGAVNLRVWLWVW